jgi:hypothetical protein
MNIFKNRKCLIATMHEKEKVIAPVLEGKFGLKCYTTNQINTDKFGTFSREIPRRKNQIRTLKDKIDFAYKVTGETLIIANEGSYSPDPQLSMITINTEMLMLKDFKNNLSYTYAFSTNNANLARKEIEYAEEGVEFAIRNGFPAQGMILYRERKFRKPKIIVKGITNEDLLWEILQSELKSGKLFIENDLRAMLNPTRMENIKIATQNFATELEKTCPLCGNPGFSNDLINFGINTSKNNASIITCQKCKLESLI